MNYDENSSVTISTEQARETLREPYPSDDVLEDLYKINACATEKEFEDLVAGETKPQPILVGQRFKLNNHWFKVKKIAKKDVVLRLCKISG